MPKQAHTHTVLREYRHFLFHPSLMEGKDTPHSSPSQIGRLLSAATALLLTIGAELEPLGFFASCYLTPFLARGWSGRTNSWDRFLREDSPGDNQGQESKQRWVTVTNIELNCHVCRVSTVNHTADGTCASALQPRSYWHCMHASTL